MTPITIMAILILFSIVTQPVQCDDQQKVGPFKEHLMEAYGKDWPHYAPWVHSEIKVADNVAAYSLRAVDLGDDLFPGVPARGALIAYATKDNKIGLVYVNETGERFKLYETYVTAPPKYREGIDINYVTDSKTKSTTILVAWGADKKLYMLRLKLTLKSYQLQNKFPIVTEVSNITEINLPHNYEDIKQVRILTLNNEFIVLFTAKSPSKPTEEYGYDLLYALVRPDGTVIKLGPKDLGFQDVMVFQAKVLNQQNSIIGLAFMGRWRQSSAGVWFSIMKLEGNSLKIIGIKQISDPDFEIPCVKRALLDFAFVYDKINSEYYVLVVWNDCRCPNVIFDRIRQLVPISEFTYVKNKTWVIYGQRLVVKNDSIIIKEGKNFPVMYLVSNTRTRIKTILGEIVETWNTDFGEIDSVTLYVSSDVNGKKYFIVDASVNTINKEISRWLSYAVYGEFEEKNTYGFDIFSVPIPVNPEDQLIVGTEVDEAAIEVSLSSFGTTQTKQVWMAYPVLNDTSEVIPKDQPSPEGLIYLYDTIQFNETYATTNPMVCKDQINVKAVSTPDGIIIEGFIDTNGKESTLFVMPSLVVVGLVKYMYLNYDHNAILSRYIYLLHPYTVIKYRAIRIEDHPEAQPGPIVYDFKDIENNKENNRLPSAYLGVVYTTDFSNNIIPIKFVLVNVLGPTYGSFPQLSGYAMLVNKNIIMKSENIEIKIEEPSSKSSSPLIRMYFLPPYIKILKIFSDKIVEISKLKDINKIKEVAKSLVENLLNYIKNDKLLSQYSNDIISKLERFDTNIKNMKESELMNTLNNIGSYIEQLVNGTYQVFIVYHPTEGYNQYTNPSKNYLNCLKQVINEIKKVVTLNAVISNEIMKNIKLILIKRLNMKDENFVKNVFTIVSDIEKVREYMNNAYINPNDLVGELMSLDNDIKDVINVINPNDTVKKLDYIIEKVVGFTNEIINIIDEMTTKTDGLIVQNYPYLNIIKADVDNIYKIALKIKSLTKRLNQLISDLNKLENYINELKGNHDKAYDSKFIRGLIETLNDLESVFSHDLKDLYDCLCVLREELSEGLLNDIDGITEIIKSNTMTNLIIPVINEIAYIGVVSWLPIDVVVRNVPRLRLIPSGKIEVVYKSVIKSASVVPPPSEEKSSSNQKVNRPVSNQSAFQVNQWQRKTSRQKGGQQRRSVPLLPVFPYRRGLSRPRSRNRS